MQLQTYNVDPMLVLMAAQCEDVQDEFDVQSLLDADEELTAADFIYQQLVSEE